MKSQQKCRLAIDIYKTDDFAPWHAPDSRQRAKLGSADPDIPVSAGYHNRIWFHDQVFSYWFDVSSRITLLAERPAKWIPAKSILQLEFLLDWIIYPSGSDFQPR